MNQIYPRTKTHRKILFTIAFTFTLGVTPKAFSADQFIEFSSLFADVYATSTGVENIVPYYEDIDEDNNGVDDKYILGFNVYANNSNTKLYSTARKSGTYLPAPCASPTWINTNTDMPKFMRSEKWAITAHAPRTECGQSNGDREEVDGTFVYVADVSKPNGVVRAFSSQSQLVGVDLVDYNSDNKKDLVITMGLETASGFKLRYLVKNLDTWSTISDKTILVGVSK